MNYTNLIAPKATAGSIANFVNDSRIESTSPFIVQEAESYIYRTLRHWRMLTAPITGAFTIGSDYIALPGDFLDAYIFVITGTDFSFIQQSTPDVIIRSWSYDDGGVRVQQQPAVYYFDQANYRFDSPPDKAYPFAQVYFQQPTALNARPAPGVNFLTQYYPRLLRAACMMMACEWLKEAGQGVGAGGFDRTYWEQVCQQEMQKAQVESDRAKRAQIFSAEAIGGGPPGILPMYM